MEARGGALEAGGGHSPGTQSLATFSRTAHSFLGQGVGSLHTHRLQILSLGQGTGAAVTVSTGDALLRSSTGVLWPWLTESVGTHATLWAGGEEELSRLISAVMGRLRLGPALVTPLAPLCHMLAYLPP